MLTVKVPRPPPVVVLVTPLPPISGSALVPSAEWTTPRSTIVPSPRSVTLPPRVAPVSVTEVKVGVVMVASSAKLAV